MTGSSKRRRRKVEVDAELLADFLHLTTGGIPSSAAEVEALLQEAIDVLAVEALIPGSARPLLNFAAKDEGREPVRQWRIGRLEERPKGARERWVIAATADPRTPGAARIAHLEVSFPSQGANWIREVLEQAMRVSS